MTTNIEKDKALARLLEVLGAGSRVYTIPRSVSRSGMMRSISLVAVNKDHEIQDITYWAAQVLAVKLSKSDGGIKMPGCGMDMGFELVYRVSCKLFDDGYALKHSWL